MEVQHAEWQRILRTGLRPRQKELAEWDQRTRLLYHNAFQELAAVASYGRTARAIINHIIKDLAAEADEDSE